jgi:hypothetical protein
MMVQRYGTFILLIMRYFLFLLLFISFTAIAQVNINFEDSTLNGWEMNSPDRWGITSSNPISGNYSLKHSYDNPDDGHDQVSIRFDELHLSMDTTVWTFSVLHEYTPSGSNNWSAFLLADKNAMDMHPGGSACAYVLGVNFKGSDDLIKVWKNTEQGTEEIYNTNYNWEIRIGTDSAATLQVIRYPDATWEIHLYKNESDTSLGSFSDASILSGNYFGFYYAYTSSGVQKLTVDDISIDGTFIIDTLPPVIEEINVNDSSSVIILFSEPLNEDSMKHPENYLIETMGMPDSIIFANADEIILHYNSGFINEKMYDLHLQKMVDLDGNEALDHIDSFFYYQAVQHDILITEIHADPLPVVDLPEFEYIEIYNQSPYDIALNGWTFRSGRAEKVFHDYTLQPKQRLILCHEDALDLLRQFGDCMDIFTSLSTLLNTKDTLFIYDQYGKMIDSVHYTDEWHDGDKKDGGWSLELTNYERQCINKANWKSSVHAAGGTPGTVNSAHMNLQDWIAPYIENSNFQPDSIITFEISNPIDTSLLSAFIWQNGLQNLSVQNINDTVFQAFAANPLTEGEFTFILQDMTDFCFHSTPVDSVQFYHHLPQRYEVIINEFLIDPVPSKDLPEYEFIELLNTSEFDINLQNWKIYSGTNFYLLPGYLLRPGETVILTHANAHDDYSSFGNVIAALGNSYYLSNKRGSLKLEAHNNVLIDSLQYNSNFYDQDLDGISLERMHTDFSCSHPQNLLPSLDASGGTPGTLNSRLSPELTSITPKLQNISVSNDSAFIIEFSDFIDTTSSIQIGLSGNYEISAYHFSDLTSMQIILDTPLKSKDTIQISLSGMFDFCGNTINDTISEVIVYFPNPSDLLITEIMADPLPVQDLPEYEYVEVYNSTGYDIDVAGWTFHTSNKSCVFEPYILPANERLILCHEDAKEHFIPYGRCLGIFSSLSTLLNTNDTILIRDKTGKTIDSVYYSDVWHQQDKNDGGWSLELTHYSRSCRPKANWNSSENPFGGTPGKINSVHHNEKDESAPIISGFQRLQDTSFVFAFNEPIEASNMVIKCVQDKPVISVKEVLSDSSVCVHTTSPLTEGNTWFFVHEIEDYCFNKTSDTIQFYHHIPASKDIIINEFMTDPTPGKGLPEYEFIELLNRSNFSINLAGWHIQTLSGSYELPSFLLNAHESVILTHTNAGNDYALFGEVLPVIGSKYFLPNEYSHIVLSSGRNGTIDSVYYHTNWYEKDLDGISLERNAWDLDCYHPLTIQPSIDPQGGTPGNQNSTMSEKPEIALPQLLSTEWLSDTILQLTFTGFIDTMASPQAAIEPGYEIKNISFDGYHALNVFTDKPISSGDTLFLEIFDLIDLCGNQLENVQLYFTSYKPVEFDLFITEIMADPEPVVGLPNAEYIEVYNASNYSINTETLNLFINDKKISILSETLKAGSYHLFIDEDDRAAFTGYENVHMLSSLNLLNSKNDIVLLNRNNEIIHFATYEKDLFQSESKSEGGWSLELSQMDNPCKPENLWLESESYRGGTPGSKNSVSSDIIINSTDLIRNIGVPAHNRIRIYLNEYIPHDHLNQLNIDILPKLDIDTFMFDLKFFALDVQTKQPLSRGKTYRLQIKNVMDCMNDIFDSKSHVIGLPLIPEPGEILFSEVMFQPHDGHPEFIEVYNASDKIIDAGNLYLQYGTSDMVRLTNQSFLLFPGDYLLLCKNKTKCSNSYMIPSNNILEMSQFPVLNNSEGVIVIKNSENTEMDKFHYSEDLHHQSLNNVDGVSLERVSFDIPTQQPGNWQSAASIVDYCTPGVQNSKYLAGFQNVNEQFKIEPEVFTPDNDGEKDILKIGYQLPEGEYTLNLSVYDPSGRLVRHLVRNEIIAPSGTLFWDGKNSEYSVVGTGIYVLFFEAVSSNGKVIRKKETCVLAN